LSRSSAIQQTGVKDYKSKVIAMKNTKAKWNCELSLQQLLSDPLVTTLMAADRVDAGELYETLSEAGRKLPHAKAAPRAKRFFPFAECRC
jgi:hypothetical protein